MRTSLAKAVAVTTLALTALFAAPTVLTPAASVTLGADAPVPGAPAGTVPGTGNSLGWG
ncbi:hypothetical protein [Streptomyces sp. TLI_053]|uniref:hypothetical protein n=1 Tax=Streptomyces sp. TLI_053 TaxID=1855352 RepID=UPI001352094F|nr:hypothetical protein [Streptomyces sp. TLI_053]